jgi:5-methylcytosine-specific restriction endonuclease McrA
MSCKSRISEKGLTRRTLKGLGLKGHKSIIEKVDNSIDACATNIIIGIFKIDGDRNVDTDEYDGEDNLKGKNILYVLDNGTGMNKKNGKLMKLLTLCEENNDAKNGKFGIAAIAGDVNLTDKLTMYFTKTKKSNIMEIILDWPNINEKGWVTSNITPHRIGYNNMDFLRYILKENDISAFNNGTIVINVIDDTKIHQIQNKLELELRVYHNKYTEKGQITFKNNINNYTFTISNNKEVNVTNRLNKQEQPSLLENRDIFDTSFSFIFDVDYTEYDTCSLIKFTLRHTSFKNIKKHSLNSCLYFNKDTRKFPRNLIGWKDKQIEEDILNQYKFKYTFNIIDPESTRKDMTYLKQISEETREKITGCYFERLGRILSDPIPLEGLRNTQTGGYWRAKLSWNEIRNDKILSVMTNKSIIQKDDIDKGLFRGISLLSKSLYSSCGIKEKYNSNLSTDTEIKLKFKEPRDNSKKSQKKSKKKSNQELNNESTQELNNESTQELNNESTQELNNTPSRRTPLKKDRNKILNDQDNLCNICKIKLNPYHVAVDIDHKQDYSRGGLSDAENCQALCVNCHRSKHNAWTKTKQDIREHISEMIKLYKDAFNKVSYEIISDF